MATRELPTPAELRQLLECDPRTGKLLWKRRDAKWFKSKRDHVRWNNRHAGTEALNTMRDRLGPLAGRVLVEKCMAHRVLWALVHGKWPDGMIDHINGDKTDNRLVNLRDVTRTENNQNCARSRKNTSGRTGVCWCNSKGRWQAYITANRARINLGEHETFEAACAVRAAAEARYGFHPNHGRERLG